MKHKLFGKAFKQRRAIEFLRRYSNSSVGLAYKHDKDIHELYREHRLDDGSYVYGWDLVK